MLITAGALAATLYGWVALASSQAQSALATPTPQAVAGALDPSAVSPSVQPQPAPTLRVVTVPRDTVGPLRPVTVTRSSR
jgi:ABC-type nitrate/sulfonate/bicarbonate transport system permease component